MHIAAQQIEQREVSPVDPEHLVVFIRQNGSRHADIPVRIQKGYQRGKHIGIEDDIGIDDGMIFRIQARDYIVMPLAKPEILSRIHIFHVVVFREALQKGALVVVVVSIAAVVDHVQPLGQGFVREAFD